MPKNKPVKKDLSPILKDHMNSNQRSSVSREDYELTRQELFDLNIPFAVSVTNKYKMPSVSQDDLIQEALLGLYIAAQRYDYREDTKFISYARFWIENKLQRHIHDMGYDVRIPTSAWVNAFTKRNHNTSKKNPELIEQTKSICRPFISLEAPLHEDAADPLCLKDVYADDAPNGLDFSEHDSLVKSIKRYLNVIDDRHAYVLTRRFGLDGMEPGTLQEIGDEIGLSRERVRQMSEKAMDIVRLNMLGEFDDLYEYAEDFGLDTSNASLKFPTLCSHPRKKVH